LVIGLSLIYPCLYNQLQKALMARKYAFFPFAQVSLLRNVLILSGVNSQERMNGLRHAW